MSEANSEFLDYTSLDESDPVDIMIPHDLAGSRIDHALVMLFPGYSRSRLQQWIKDGAVKLNGQLTVPKEKVWTGDQVSLVVPEEIDLEAIIAQPIDLNIVHEDDDIIVLNKPAGLVVHPGNGNWSNTLQNGLLYYDEQLKMVPRCGIVHRLDKETNGLMVVAKNLPTHQDLVQQLQARTVKRHYWACVQGMLTMPGQVEAPISRHPTQRTKMAVVATGKEALTYYDILERLPCHTLVECHLATGRTHQIRVHMQFIGHPLAGDPVYGGKLPRYDEHTIAALKQLNRQALQAFRLGLIHPRTKEYCEWSIPLAEDLLGLVEVLRHSHYE
ncbi:23S rRNA pseudouridine(1911/1915/1917) synthase RluD [Ferrovum sp. PN-J185]|uniref:23S rRNA pseudouridine(1911/1915/1917) synthase RluD n=1 Tax=Ferrovum sp. PN-J185 TaxID=1356306 RepID=UPI00079ADFC2|nr:23S rRNA pseudouridine(1911/1915/1917) synthase RluD [Ferrovum sp. PN-J185]KXW56332.1 ribosomal large subunit pseudouridine synthase D [Ferrovum sp. PN-J185]MCC6069056.1 23S rRNA pseudouridine(1911/1915/1917) synthase RluD [Ferrovum sp. PN-J185]MDE1890964.1 23S rRNA pseudouridine(1911/1915/1917) synthase RluD [Betaproteobacteria bacterium]MDE2055724.1 23S rRNA pseudouridine(1911/1915/1917) synthase RluD [Betaproteobacteria bacterium]